MQATGSLGTNQYKCQPSPSEAQRIFLNQEGSLEGEVKEIHGVGWEYFEGVKF